MNERTSRILIVDDEPDIREHLLDLVARHLRGVHADGAADADEALEAMTRVPYDVIVTDMRMPGTDGLELLRRVRAASPSCARLLMTGYGDVNVVTEAVNECHVHAFFTKPLDSRAFVRILAEALEQQRAARESHLAMARAFSGA